MPWSSATGVPRVRELLRERPGDVREVHDPGVRRVQRRRAAAVRLDLGDLAGRQAPQPRHLVLAPSPLELVEPAQLALVARDDQLPAALVLDPLGLAELVHLAGALDAQASLERAGHVVDARVDDAAVGARLAAGDGRPVLEHDRVEPGAAAGQLAGDGQPEDPAPDDGQVALLRCRRHLSPLASGARRWRAARGRSRPSASPCSSKLVVGAPAELLARLARVADQVLDLGGAQVIGVDADVVLGVEARRARTPRPPARAPSAPRRSRSRSRRARPAGASATSPRRSPWRSPSRARRRGCRAPRSSCEPELDRGGGVGDLARDELEPAPLALVVEEDPAAGEQVVGLAVVDRDEVAVALGHAVGRARVERGASRSAAPPAPGRTSPSWRPGRSARRATTSRIASRMRVTPTAVNSAVSTGWDQDAATNDIAARL